MFINNIFGEIPEKNVIFVIDTSGSMYDVLASVKDHIAEVLIDRAYNRPGTYFNVIEFSSEVRLVFTILYKAIIKPVLGCLVIYMI